MADDVKAGIALDDVAKLIGHRHVGSRRAVRQCAQQFSGKRGAPVTQRIHGGVNRPTTEVHYHACDIGDIAHRAGKGLRHCAFNKVNHVIARDHHIVNHRQVGQCQPDIHRFIAGIAISIDDTNLQLQGIGNQPLPERRRQREAVGAIRRYRQIVNGEVRANHRQRDFCTTIIATHLTGEQLCDQRLSNVKDPVVKHLVDSHTEAFVQRNVEGEVVARGVARGIR